MSDVAATGTNTGTITTVTSGATPVTPSAPPTPPDPAPTAQAQPLGEPGLKALQAERERADRLETELKGLKPLREQFEALKGVFGDKAKGETPEDIVKGLQSQVETLQRENAVNALARTYGITDETDIARLTKIADPDLRADIAARLKPTQAAPAAPQTDPGQGARPGTQSVEDAEYAQFYPSR